MSSRQRSDSGFTLLELLVAVAVLGVVMTALVGGLFVSQRAMNVTSKRIAGSTDAQLVSIHFPPDVQSANTALTTGMSCSGVSAPLLLQLKRVLTDGSVNFNVAYGVSGSELRRYDCLNGTAIAVAHNLNSSSPVTISPSPLSGSFTYVSMAVTELKGSMDASNYQFTVTGGKRAS